MINKKTTVEDCNKLYQFCFGENLESFTQLGSNEGSGDVKRFTPDEFFNLFMYYREEKGWLIEYEEDENGNKTPRKGKPVLISMAGFANWLRGHGALSLSGMETYTRENPMLRAAIDDAIEEHTVVFTGSGAVNAAMGIFYLKNKLSYTDKIEQNITSEQTHTLQLVDDLRNDED